MAGSEFVVEVEDAELVTGFDQTRKRAGFAGAGVAEENALGDLVSGG